MVSICPNPWYIHNIDDIIYEGIFMDISHFWCQTQWGLDWYPPLMGFNKLLNEPLLPWVSVRKHSEWPCLVITADVICEHHLITSRDLVDLRLKLSLSEPLSSHYLERVPSLAPGHRSHHRDIELESSRHWRQHRAGVSGETGRWYSQGHNSGHIHMWYIHLYGFYPSVALSCHWNLCHDATW